MLNAMEQLDLEPFLLRLHDIYGSITELVWKGVVDLCTRKEQWLCNIWISIHYRERQLESLTGEIEEVRLFQKGWVCECTGCADAFT